MSNDFCHFVSRHFKSFLSVLRFDQILHLCYSQKSFVVILLRLNFFFNLELDLKATVKTTKIETILKKQPSTFKVQADPN